jgi:hypothetical protein
MTSEIKHNYSSDKVNSKSKLLESSILHLKNSNPKTAYKAKSLLLQWRHIYLCSQCDYQCHDEKKNNKIATREEYYLKSWLYCVVYCIIVQIHTKHDTNTIPGEGGEGGWKKFCMLRMTERGSYQKRTHQLQCTIVHPMSLNVRQRG